LVDHTKLTYKYVMLRQTYVCHSIIKLTSNRVKHERKTICTVQDIHLCNECEKWT